VVYLDASVLLAQIFGEDRCPPEELWSETLVASRLLEYETWNRLHARGIAEELGEPARQLLARVSMLELAPPVLTRALEPFPVPLRTLDALHLASLDFLRRQGQSVRLATYDQRLAAGAEALGIPLHPLG
jgi:predicted nucleic acid-binding protein